jgi:hypothetical protein
MLEYMLRRKTSRRNQPEDDFLSLLFETGRRATYLSLADMAGKLLWLCLRSRGDFFSFETLIFLLACTFRCFFQLQEDANDFVH